MFVTLDEYSRDVSSAGPAMTLAGWERGRSSTTTCTYGPLSNITQRDEQRLSSFDGHHRQDGVPLSFHFHPSGRYRASALRGILHDVVYHPCGETEPTATNDSDDGGGRTGGGDWRFTRTPAADHATEQPRSAPCPASSPSSAS